MKYHKKNGEIVLLEKVPIASGGEGIIYRLNTDRSLVAKIYTKKGSKLATYQSKIKYMINNNPLKSADQEIQNAIIWPNELLYNSNGEFAGYIMKCVNNKVTITNFTLTLDQVKYLGKEYDKFSLYNKWGLFKRLLLFKNILKAVNIIHQMKVYVLCDFKPDNILTDAEGRISIIDMDSIQINDGNTKFSATAHTPEYSPPEFHNNLTGTFKNVNWDLFSIAILGYELLLGISPFIASHKDYHTVPELIANGLFVHGKNSGNLQVIPKPHQNFKKLPIQLQNAFIKSLDHGSLNNSNRLSVLSWIDIINEVITNHSDLSDIFLIAQRAVKTPQP